MSCTPVLSAYKRGCKDISGVQDVWIIDKNARKAVVDLVLSISEGSLSITPGTSQPDAYHIIPRQNSLSFDETENTDNDAGTSSITQVLAGLLHGGSPELAYLMDNLRKGVSEVLIRKRNGKFQYAGLDELSNDVGLESGGITSASGQGVGDASGYNVNLTGTFRNFAPYLASMAEFTTAFNVIEPS